MPHTPKGHQFDSWSGHIARLQVWFPVRVHMGDNRWCFTLTSVFPSLFISIPLSPKSVKACPRVGIKTNKNKNPLGSRDEKRCDLGKHFSPGLCFFICSRWLLQFLLLTWHDSLIHPLSVVGLIHPNVSTSTAPPVIYMCERGDPYATLCMFSKNKVCYVRFLESKVWWLYQPNDCKETKSGYFEQKKDLL